MSGEDVVRARLVNAHERMTELDRQARGFAMVRNDAMRDLRAHGWTLQQLADLLGVSLSAVAKAVK